MAIKKRQLANTEIKITIIAYSPLAQDLFTGKFQQDPRLVEKLSFYRKKATGHMLEMSLPLIALLEEISSSYNLTPSEAALKKIINYAGDTFIAIPGVSKADHIVQNVNPMTLKLTVDEMKKLDVISRYIV